MTDDRVNQDFRRPDGSIVTLSVHPFERLDEREHEGERVVPVTSADFEDPDANPIPAAGRSRVHEVAYGKDKRPVSRALPRRPVDPAVCTEEKLGGYTVWKHKDGGLTTAGGQPIIDSKAAADRELSRTGFKRNLDMGDDT